MQMPLKTCFGHWYTITALLTSMFAGTAPAVMAVELRGSSTPRALQLNDVDQTLSRLEQQVFGMQNVEAPVATRLELLEAKLFGAEQDGSLLQRVTKLSEKIYAQPQSSAPAKEVKKEVSRTPKPLIKGAVHEFDLAQFGIDTTEDIQPGAAKKTVIRYVVPLSAAEIWGMEPGDVILKVQMNQQSTVITISRNGKVYSADLAAQRETLFSAKKIPIDPTPNVSASNVSAPPRPAVSVRHYTGHLGNGFNFTQEITSPVTTDFDVTPSGIATGKYHQSAYDGILSEGKALSQHEYCFRWQDVYGDGTLLVTFSDDMSSFTGFWTPWHRKSGINSDTDPYENLMQVKGSGLRWDGNLMN